MSAFQELLDELAAEQQQMAKALEDMGDGDGDEDGGEGGGDGDGDELDGGEGGEGGEGDEGDEYMGKALDVTLSDGKKVQAIDGTDLVKSLITKQQGMSAELQSVAEQVAGLLKSQNALISEQGTRIKSLEKSIAGLGSAGRGRKARVTVQDRNSVSGDIAGNAGGSDLMMMKANEAFDAKKISGLELATIDAHARARTIPPEDLLKKIVA